MVASPKHHHLVALRRRKATEQPTNQLRKLTELKQNFFQAGFQK
jgi:hypothetical protein